ncbi:CRISPR-associated endonuclease Cas2 [Kamptonema cortianum]|nr:CRISPR-associated endonuclease Cas2 [Kamptonema cortianum]
MEKVNILACYDVRTNEDKGKARLRKMAKACEAYGQRVQNSVFELAVTETNYQRFLTLALKIMEPSEDSLRIYVLNNNREQFVRVFGVDRWQDFDGTLIV